MKTQHFLQIGRISRVQLSTMAIIIVLGALAGAWIVRDHDGAPRPSAEASRDEREHDKDADEDKKRVEAHERSSEAQTTEASSADQTVPLSADQIKSAAIVVAQVAAARIQTSVQMPGEVHFNEDRTARLSPRLAGVVDSVAVNLGQQVKKGQVLATLSSTTLSDLRSELLTAQKRLSLARTTYEREKKLFEDKISPEMDYLQAQQTLREAEIAQSNAKQKLKAMGATPAASDLNRYELRAPIDGMVIDKHLAVGEAVKEDAQVFTLSDLSTVWADINVSAKDLALVHVGQKVWVHASGLDDKASGTVSYVGALIGEQTRTAIARVVLSNPKLAWRPGLFVTVEVGAGKTEAAVAVQSSAIQVLEGHDVVFVEVPGGFKARQVKLGRSDERYTEILSGLKPSERYAAANSFVIKAEMGKASADHDE